MGRDSDSIAAALAEHLRGVLMSDWIGSARSRCRLRFRLGIGTHYTRGEIAIQRAPEIICSGRCLRIRPPVHDRCKSHSKLRLLEKPYIDACEPVKWNLNFIETHIRDVRRSRQGHTAALCPPAPSPRLCQWQA